MASESRPERGGEKGPESRITGGEGGAVMWRVAGEGPTLVLLHGGAGSWTHWTRNIPALSGRFRLLVPDMPGFGQSDAAVPPQDADAIAARILAGIDILAGPAAPFFLAGFSFGGLIAGRVAMLAGARLRRLVLVGPSGLGLTSSMSLPLRSWRGLADAKERAECHRHNLRVLMFAPGTGIDDATVAIQALNAERARVDSRPISRRPILRDTLAGLGFPWLASGEAPTRSPRMIFNSGSRCCAGSIRVAASKSSRTLVTGSRMNGRRPSTPRSRASCRLAKNSICRGRRNGPRCPAAARSTRAPDRKPPTLLMRGMHRSYPPARLHFAVQ